MVKERTIFLTKRRHRLKFPLPYASILPEPSTTKTKSILARHTARKCLFTKKQQWFQYTRGKSKVLTRVRKAMFKGLI